MILAGLLRVTGPLADLLPEGSLQRAAVYRVLRDEIVPYVRSRVIETIVPEPPRRGPGSPPYVWSRDKAANERGRRGYFARVRDGRIATRNGYYQRSGDLARNWTVYVVDEGAFFRVVVENDSGAASFVYGSDRRPRVPGHRTTGWPKALAFILDIFDLPPNLVKMLNGAIAQ